LRLQRGCPTMRNIALISRKRAQAFEG